MILRDPRGQEAWVPISAPLTESGFDYPHVFPVFHFNLAASEVAQRHLLSIPWCKTKHIEEIIPKATEEKKREREVSPKWNRAE